MAEGCLPSVEYSSIDPPTRSKSESDTPLIPTSRPTLNRLSSHTYGHSKSLFHGRNTKKQWKFAVKKTKQLVDPWGHLGMDALPMENVIRYMYNPHSKEWRSDLIVVKMQTESFAHGAMRECFRMKKLSKFSQNPDWKNASNYVAKRYMKEVSRETYFEDVKLQMDSKLWGEEYNKLGLAPKKVDFFQTYIIEFKGREGSPLYGVEHFIEGGYVKYNSNSGFVSDVNRLTPQTFSHFTFERSNHQLIIVDIQGVGDLYTDPQMHTVDQKDYGEANLGVRGMALFFFSHVCSPLCNALGLTQFDLSEREMETLHSKRWNFSTPTTQVIDRDSSSDSGTRNLMPKETVQEAFNRLSLSINAESLRNTQTKSFDGLVESPLDSPVVTTPSAKSHPLMTTTSLSQSEPQRDSVDLDTCPINELDTCPIDGEFEAVFEGVAKADEEREGALHSSSVEEGQSREKGITVPSDALQILGMIHLDLARLHESGRFVSDQSPVDENAINFHLERAARCGNLMALYTLAHINLQQPHQEFQNLVVEASVENEAIGMNHLLLAAKRGLRPAMFELAKAMDTGITLGSRDPDWSQATHWYHKVLEDNSQTQTNIDTDAMSTIDPDYLIQARLAELYHTGGNGLVKDPQRAGDLYTQAAEGALSAMKGKLSTKYYMLAEEAWGEMED